MKIVENQDKISDEYTSKSAHKSLSYMEFLENPLRTCHRLHVFFPSLTTKASARHKKAASWDNSATMSCSTDGKPTSEKRLGPLGIV